MSARQVEVKLGKPHAVILANIINAESRFLDVEGALRSAKTWTILAALRMVLEQEPGVKLFISRWTEGDLYQKLVPDYRNVCALMGLPIGQWDAKETCYNFPNGSRLYAVHLKSNQTDNRYAKVRGLTVARGYIDQLEELPEDVYQEAALRLSQPGFKQQMVVSPNPVPETHWIARTFPTNNQRPDHRHITLAIWDNKHNLDPGTIRAAESLYPVGHPQRGVKLEGRRGLDVRGVPVYMGAFDRKRHVAVDSLPVNASLPLIEAYDFGFHHPCVTWYQWAPWGLIRCMGGLLGVDLHLNKFLPIVQRYREQWFPRRRMLLACCDPAGAAENSQGLEGTPVKVLGDWYRHHGEELVSPQFLPDSNHPERRVAANQIVATYMQRDSYTGDPCFLVEPERWRLVSAEEERFDTFFIDGLEAGYVLEDEPRHSSKLGTFWVPKKDGFYEHPMNTFEYAVLNAMKELPLGDAVQPKKHEQFINDVAIKQAIEARRALRNQQRDTHPIDAPRGIPISGRPMGGFRRGFY